MEAVLNNQETKKGAKAFLICMVIDLVAVAVDFALDSVDLVSLQHFKDVGKHTKLLFVLLFCGVAYFGESPRSKNVGEDVFINLSYGDRVRGKGCV